MAAEPEHRQHDDDPLESTELAGRLRRMKWPPAPPEMKARVLERIVEHADGGRGRGEGARAPESTDG